jgi:hypothetical protein
MTKNNTIIIISNKQCHYHEAEFPVESLVGTTCWFAIPIQVHKPMSKIFQGLKYRAEMPHVQCGTVQG